MPSLACRQIEKISIVAALNGLHSLMDCSAIGDTRRVLEILVRKAAKKDAEWEQTSQLKVR